MYTLLNSPAWAGMYILQQLRKFLKLLCKSKTDTILILYSFILICGAQLVYKPIKLDIWHGAQAPHVIAIPFRTLYLKSFVKLFRSVPFCEIYPAVFYPTKVLYSKLIMSKMYCSHLINSSFHKLIKFLWGPWTLLFLHPCMC